MALINNVLLERRGMNYTSTDTPRIRRKTVAENSPKINSHYRIEPVCYCDRAQLVFRPDTCD